MWGMGNTLCDKKKSYFAAYQSALLRSEKSCGNAFAQIDSSFLLTMVLHNALCLL